MSHILDHKETLSRKFLWKNEKWTRVERAKQMQMTCNLLYDRNSGFQFCVNRITDTSCSSGASYAFSFCTADSIFDNVNLIPHSLNADAVKLAVNCWSLYHWHTVQWKVNLIHRYLFLTLRASIWMLSVNI